MEVIEGEIIDIKDETPWVKTLKLELDSPLGFVPGQFLLVVVPGERPLLRAYSIASSPKDDFIELCVTRIEGGKASTYLHGLSVGDPIRIRGPSGKFVLEKTENPILFIATGSGIAPFRSMIRFALESGWKNEMHLLFGVRTRSDVIFAEEWTELSKLFPHFHPLITFSREKGPEKGYVQTKLPRYHHLKAADVYICGNGKMVMETKAILEKDGFKNIFYERYN